METTIFKYYNHLSGVSQIDSLDAVVVGDTGVLLRTSDGGNNWAQEINGINNNITALSFRNNLQGIALGNSGLVLVNYRWGHYCSNKTALWHKLYVLYATDSILYSGCSSLMKNAQTGEKLGNLLLIIIGMVPTGGSSSVSIIAKRFFAYLYVRKL